MVSFAESIIVKKKKSLPEYLVFIFVVSFHTFLSSLCFLYVFMYVGMDIGKTGLELEILLLPPPVCVDHSHRLSHSALTFQVRFRKGPPLLPPIPPTAPAW